MRMTRHTHNATRRHTQGAYIGYTRTNRTARGQGAGHARRGLFIYGLRHHCTLHLLSAQMRLRGGDHSHPPRPASSFVPHAACVRRGVGADAAQPDQRDPCAAARHILGSRARATPGPPSGAVGDALAEDRGKRPPPVAAGCRTANAAAGSAPSAPRTPWSPPAAPCAP